MPWEFWRTYLAQKFGQTPASVDEWQAKDVHLTIAVLNAIANAEKRT